jgi:hypothetical protein
LAASRRAFIALFSIECCVVRFDALKDRKRLPQPGKFASR